MFYVSLDTELFRSIDLYSQDCLEITGHSVVQLVGRDWMVAVGLPGQSSSSRGVIVGDSLAMAATQ